MSLHKSLIANAIKQSATVSPQRGSFFCIAMVASAVQCAYAMPLKPVQFMPATYVTSGAANKAVTAHSIVVFVDSRVLNAEQLMAEHAATAEVIYLNAYEEGLIQIARAMQQRSNVLSIQIISHGDAGQLQLGSGLVANRNLNAYNRELQVIKQSLQQGGDILLLGCNVGAGKKGQVFVNTLAAMTGSDVAASNNFTGNSGDWVLEITTGVIDTALALNLASTANYKHDLATLTVTNNSNSGVGSLRSAIADANNGDTITFNAGMTIGLNSELIIAKDLIIDGDLNNDGVADVTVDAQYKSRVINITSGKTATFDGLVITKGLLAGNGGNSVNGGAAAGNAFGAGILNAGNLTLNNTLVNANAASGGGGGGGFGYYAGGGGGGGGIGGGNGGNGGKSGSNFSGVGGTVNTGGHGGGFMNMGGRGGTSIGGLGGDGFYGYSQGGNGGSVTNGTLSIGGGGGGSATGGIGGSAAGGIYNASTGTLKVIGSSVISNNIAAGGGGGGGRGGHYGTVGNGGDSGRGVGAIWNKGSVLITAANFSALAGNAGASGTGGPSNNGSPGAAPVAVNAIHNEGGTLNTNFVPGPSITGSSYNAATGTLALTATNMLALAGAANDIDASKFTFTGEGAASYTLTDTSNAEISSATSAVLTLSATDKAAVNTIINKNGAASTGATTYNLAAADDWNAAVTADNTADLSNSITASNVAVPSITAAAYDGATGSLVVTGANFSRLAGASNDVIANKFTFTGQGGSTYTLADTSNV